MLGPKRIKVTEVNPHLICVLCRGYYIDATTIIECLHSFCKTCIVKYLQSNKYCPICDVQVHKTSPLLNIRSDKTLQNIVYKLVPSLFKSEMERRIEFYRQHPEHLPAIPEERGELSESCPIFLPDEVLVLCLEYLCDKPPAEMMPKRFIHCPAEMTLSHLIKLIRGKFNLLPTHQVNILFKDDLLSEHLTVMEVAYTYQCRRRVPIHLYYRILELKKTTIRLLEVKERKDEVAQGQSNQDGETNQTEQTSKAEKRPASSEGAVIEKNLVVEKGPQIEKSNQSNENIDNEWKEVQLQISENGVMSVRNMKNSECSPKPAVEAPTATSQNNSQPVAQLCSTPVTQTISTTSMLSSTQVTKPTTSNGPVVSLPSELTTSIIPTNYSASPRIPSTKPILSVSKVTKDQVKKDFNNVEANKLSISRVPAMGFKEKSEALNKIVSKLSPNERVIGNTSVTIRPVLSTPPNVKTYQPPAPQIMQPVQPPSKVQKPERKQQQTVKYKTLSSPTKQWNPSIDRSTMLTMKQNYDMSKPPRFFKMRNMPRYLGNPASGVKPMYGTSNEDTSKDSKPRSPTKLPPPFTPGSPKGGKSPFPDKTSWTPRVPSPAHSGSLYNANPYLLYSGFPGSFTPDPSMLANANPDLMRTMFANSAYHPSLPPSINMLFNPLHNVPRPTLDSPSLQRVQRTKTPPSKVDEKMDKPIPNLIPASLPSHVISRSPTLPPSTLGINPGPSIPPHPSHPPGSLLPLNPSVVPPRLPPPLSISSTIHHHNPLLHQSPPIHSTLLRPLGSPRAPSPVGSPRTSSPLHTSPPKPLPSSSRTSSPKPRAEAQRKSPTKTEARTEVKSPLPQPTPVSVAPSASSPLPPVSTSVPATSSSTTCTVAPSVSTSPSCKPSATQQPVQNDSRSKQSEEEARLPPQSSEPVDEKPVDKVVEKGTKEEASNNNNIDKESDPVANNESVPSPIPNDK